MAGKLKDEMRKVIEEGKLRELLARLCDDEALEIVPGDGDIMYIPYLMNAAAEAYLILSGCMVPGSMPDDFSDVKDVALTQNAGRRGLILKGMQGNLGTLWYDRCEYECRLYQYHRIMHCWVKGDEHLRMLVYMTGIIRDKWMYLGGEYCNDMEKLLLTLLEYPPFRSFSPIHEPIDDWYPDTKEGRQAARVIAMLSKDAKLEKLIRMEGIGRRLFTEKVRAQLQRSEPFFDCLYDLIKDASKEYALRGYDGPAGQALTRMREDVTHNLLQRGYEGEYPSFKRGSSKITVFEEHPFTVPALDEMDFAYHLLIHDEGGYHVAGIDDI